MQSYEIKHKCFERIEFEDEQISILDGMLTVHSGFKWRSFSMGFHAPLVFFGLARMGVLDNLFVYGQPWTTEQSLLRAVLLQYMEALSLERAAIDRIYAQGLVEAKVPFPTLWAGLACRFGRR